MAWRILFSQRANRDFLSLEKTEAERIQKKLEEAAENPAHFFGRLSGAEDYKLKVGDYRIIVLLLHEKEIVFVEKIGHRKNIYK